VTSSWPRALYGALATALLVVAVGCGSSANIETGSELVVATTTPTVVVTTAPDPTSIPTEPAAVPTPTALAVPAPVPAATEPPATAEPEPTVEAAPGAAEPPVQPRPTASQPASTAQPAAGASGAVAIANGGEVYTLNCARCHAENGAGAEPYFAALVGVGSKYSTAGMINELTNGHPVTFGFADRLSEDEIASVVAYVKATFG